MKKQDELRSPLGRIRGLGSARHGTEHWWALRLTSLALIFLCCMLNYMRLLYFQLNVSSKFRSRKVN